MLRAIFIFCSALVLTGCATRVPTDTIRSSMSSGSVSELRQKMEDTHDSFGEFVTALNVARLMQLEGRWQDSIRMYDEALSQLEAYEARAIINVREVAATVGTILIARGAKSYYGTGYERSLLHTFNALNYVMLGDFSGAAVEMRKMDKRQEYWLQESEARIQKNLDKSGSAALPVQYSMRDMLSDETVRTMLNSYQDSFSYSLSSILFRIEGDLQASDVNLRRAVALDPGAGELFRHAWPQPKTKPKPKAVTVAKKRKKVKTEEPVKEETVKEEAVPIHIPPLSPLRLKSAAKEGPALGETVSRERELPEMQEVTIIAFSGLAPALKVEHVRVRFPAIGYILLDLPSLTRPVSGPVPQAADHTRAPLVFYPLLRTDRLAYRTLKDEVNFEMASAASRAAVRAGVSAAVYATARSNDDTRDYAELAGVVSTLLMDLWTYSMTVSVRNWETLPNEGYLAMTMVPRGSTITFSEGKGLENMTLPNDIRGVIIMLTQLSNNHVRMDYVTD